MAHRSRPLVEQLTAGFARASDASYAISILQASGEGPVRASIEPVLDERGETRLVVLHIALEGVSRDRALAAIGGAHGVEMASPVPLPTVGPLFEDITVRSA